jgi:nicotinamide-nucleotide amidase
MVCTGNELLDGSVLDTNTQRCANALKAFGLRIAKTTHVPDERAAIALAVTQAVAKSDLVIVSGGLGPTTDDITLEVSAHALGKKLIVSSAAKENVVNRFKKLRRKVLNRSQAKQFLIPEGARVLKNEEGTAPGIQMSVGYCTVFFLPGVPREFDHLLRVSVLLFLKEYRSPLGEHLFVGKVFGKRESELSELMESLKLPDEIEVGFRTFLPENHIKLLIAEKSFAAAEKKAKKIFSRLEQRLEKSAVFWVETSFEEFIFQELLGRKQKVAIAESCTGGLVNSMLTRVAGSSRVLDRGFVTYSNESKIELLGVRTESLRDSGAVSKEVSAEMALGALKKSRADRAVAVTGIAGPSGGSRQKPVGTVWISAASRKRVQSKVLHLPFDRELNQKFSAYEALRMLLEV